MPRIKLFAFVFIVLLLFPLPAYAYIDPGTGSMILQVLAAGLLASSVRVFLFK